LVLFSRKYDQKYLSSTLRNPPHKAHRLVRRQRKLSRPANLHSRYRGPNPQRGLNRVPRSRHGGRHGHDCRSCPWYLLLLASRSYCYWSMSSTHDERYDQRKGPKGRKQARVRLTPGEAV
jgi:hypothetical protein